MKVNWVIAKGQLATLTDEEKVIVDMLADHKTQPEVAKALGQHRSMIWRKVEKIKKQLPTD